MAVLVGVFQIVACWWGTPTGASAGLVMRQFEMHPFLFTKGANLIVAEVVPFFRAKHLHQGIKK